MADFGPDSLRATDLAVPSAPLPISPFRWDEERRAHLRAQLDAFFLHKYGLTEKETAYVLDPKAVHGEDFPGETFRVLKENEEKKHRDYRTRTLVLDYYRSWERGDMEPFERWAPVLSQPLDLQPFADHVELTLDTRKAAPRPIAVGPAGEGGG